MPTRSEIVGTSTRSSSAWSTPINPVIPWYVGAESPSLRARPSDAVLPTTSGMRVCGTGSAVEPRVTTASQPNRSTTRSAHAANVDQARWGSTPLSTTRS